MINENSNISALEKWLVKYEVVNAPFWVGLIGWDWLQKIAASYYAKKTKKKVDKMFSFERRGKEYATKYGAMMKRSQKDGFYT